jgi:elongation factor P hydroxylase
MKPMVVGSNPGDVTACSAQLVEALFQRCFYRQYNTRLCGGGEEPVYLPAHSETTHHRLIYRADYVASALHETAHWCIAGRERRRQVDFGYWYAPDGRDRQQQRAFERAEVKPQALEWIFAEALGLGFRLSTDNLSGCGGERGDSADAGEFADRVYGQVLRYCQSGLPARAARFADLLANTSGRGNPLLPRRYDRNAL